MICFSKESNFGRFNPVLGSSYGMKENPYKNVEHFADHVKNSDYIISFIYSDKHENTWYFKTLEAAQQTLEWLDQLYGVKFIPNEILKQENKEND